jgi:alpha-L-fucosidase
VIVANLANCARGGGNYLLNIGPKPDGSIPEESVAVLETVGKWLETNGKAIYGTDRGEFGWNSNANYTRRGTTLYIHQQYWPGHTPAAEWLSFYKPEAVIAIAGLKAKAKRARLLKTAEAVQFTQDEWSLRLTGLPLTAPDQPATVIEVECDGVPEIDRACWKRTRGSGGSGIGATALSCAGSASRRMAMPWRRLAIISRAIWILLFFLTLFMNRLLVDCGIAFGSFKQTSTTVCR